MAKTRFIGPPTRAQNRRTVRKTRRAKKRAMGSIWTRGPASGVKPRVQGLRVTTETSADAKQFNIALHNPFHPNAVGARVPDAYQIATVTHHTRGAIQVVSNASGVASLLLLPSPCLTAVTDTTTGVSGLTAFAQNSTSYYRNDPTGLSNVLTEYRTVACGFRLVAKDTATNTKGKVYVARVPTTANAPSWNTLQTVTASSPDVVATYTAGVTITTASNVMNLPGVRVFSMQDLLRGEVVLSAVPSHQDFYTFKGTMDRSVLPWNTGVVLADEGVFNNTTGLVNATAGGRKDVASLRGGSAFLIYASGLPATSNPFDVEFVFHTEGVPNNAGSTLVPSSQRVTQGSTSAVEKMIQLASRAASVINFVTGGSAGAGTSALLFARDFVRRVGSRPPEMITVD